MEEHINFRKTYLKFGLISGILITILDLSLLISENYANPISNLSYLFIAVLIFLAFSSYKKQGDGYLNYSRALGLGTMMTLIGGVISAFSNFIYKLIDEGVTEKVLEASRQALLEQGYSASEIEQTMKFSSFLTEPVPSFFLEIIWYTLVGFIFSLVLGAIAKKNNPNPFE